MKKNLLLFCCIFFFFVTKAQQPLATTPRPFITTWNTGLTGEDESKNNQIFFKATGKNFTVSWVNMNNASDTGSRTASAGDTITFATQGIYKVYITPGSGTFSAITFNVIYYYDDMGDAYFGDNYKLLSIEQWGDIQWTTFDSAFYRCENMVLNAADTPNLSNVKDMSNMFFDCSSLTTNAAMNNWNTSHINNMNNTFESARAFNQSISSWDVSNVTNMGYMFAATAFNQPIGNWNVSNVSNMGGMFASAGAFNQAISTWNVSDVTNMHAMFASANAFNQPIGNWNVSKVTDMSYMFLSTPLFNQPIGSWNVSNVINMGGIFQGSQLFNQPLVTWNVSNVTDMSYMFAGAQSFNGALGTWNIHKVKNTRSMFQEAASFNQPLPNWHVNDKTDMAGMFFYATSFNQNIGNWNLSGAHSMLSMFDYSGMDCSHYSQTLKGWADSTTTPNGLTLGAAGLTYDSAFAQAARDSLTNIKGWTIGGDAAGHCSVILPVNFISFNATQQGNTAVLNWRVADEINAKGYDVEKSLNGYNYNATGYINADGKQTNYTFTDNNLTSGISYYRIKEVDNDGKYMYSTVRKIEYSKFTWKINGNPVKNSSVSLMLDKAANVSIQVVSFTGNVIKTIQKGNLVTGNYTIPLNMNNVSNGTYLIRLIVDDKSYTATVVK